MRTPELYDHQKKAIENMKTGSILCGGVGSGKSLTSLFYYVVKECGGMIDNELSCGFLPMKDPKDLYIITTARKRDTNEWLDEAYSIGLSPDKQSSLFGTSVYIDSWNNIKKYIEVKDAFFIFDEQRVVGSGEWVRSFLKITKKNHWILLSATPGDTWLDYVPVFIANGFYKNRTDFTRQHVVYSYFSKFPKVDHYIGTGKLNKYRRDILVDMAFTRQTRSHHENIIIPYDKTMLNVVTKRRWNPFTEEPIMDVSELCACMRKVVNTDPGRLQAVYNLLSTHKRAIIFYNYDYELQILRSLNYPTREWNGHKHEPLPTGDAWAYLVQYTAGCEGWNCITTDTIIFYSQNYSYKVMVQAAGRVDRMNTPYKDLYYYHLISMSPIDRAITKALESKKNFNESVFK